MQRFTRVLAQPLGTEAGVRTLVVPVAGVHTAGVGTAGVHVVAGRA